MGKIISHNILTKYLNIDILAILWIKGTFTKYEHNEILLIKNQQLRWYHDWVGMYYYFII